MIFQAEHSYPLLKKRRSVDILVCTVLISLLLHITAAIFFLLPGSYSSPPPVSAPVFIDLQSIPSPLAADENSIPPPAVTDVSPSPGPELLPEASPETARLHKSIESSLRKAAQAPGTIHESSIGLGMVSGHFASFAEGESLKDEIRVYYFSLMRRINEVWWMSGAAKGSFTSAAAVNLHISRDGKVIGCELLESSGSREQDQALLDAVKRAEPLPPLPANYPRKIFSAPIRFVPPLRLMLPGSPTKTASPH